MEPQLRKSTSTTTNDMPSPSLLRRRLSAPETVMRKYKLARVRSQENHHDHQHLSKFEEFSYNSYGGSELSLQKKKDSSVVMRKSTLLRRLMNNPKTFGSSSFQEWQHYCGKLSTPSLNSLQASPEHISKSYSRKSLVGYEFKTSPKHTYGSRKVSPIRQVYEPHKSSLTYSNTSPKRKTDVHTENSSNYYTQVAREKSSMSSQKKQLMNQLTNPKSFADHSDSAYSNDRSNFSPISMSSCSTNTNLTTQEASRFKNEKTDMINHQLVDENRNFSMNTSSNYVTQESATQTSSTTNLNVISNVKLSQQTLDLIVSEVMRDVHKSCSNGNDVGSKSGNAIHVRQITGFYTKPDGFPANQQEQLSKLKNDVRDTLPRNPSSRFSAVSSKSSLGIRLESYTDDNSDMMSADDSLDETSSSKLSIQKHDNKPVRGDLPPLLTNTEMHLNKTVKPPDSFFVPMKTTEQQDVKSVSDCLPDKVKEKILQRQLELQDKLSQSRSSTTSNVPPVRLKQRKKIRRPKPDISLNSNLRNKARIRKPILPSIEPTKKFKIETNNEKVEISDRVKTKKFKRKVKENLETTNESRISETVEDFGEKNFRLYKTENEYLYDGGPRRIYHKAEFRNCNKRIEILEIMECLDINDKDVQNTRKSKSKIPVLVNNKMGPQVEVSRRPKYLDFDEVVISDPKLDQLIANILIQTMNEKEKYMTNHTSPKLTSSGEVNPPETGAREVIQDEISKDNKRNLSQRNTLSSITNHGEVKLSESNSNEVMHEDQISNDNDRNVLTSDSTNECYKVPENHHDIKSIENNNCKGRSTSEVHAETQYELPDGWDPLYVPQTNEESVENTSNEGRKQDYQASRGGKQYSRSEENDSVEKQKNLNGRMLESYDLKNMAIRKKDNIFKEIMLPPPITRRHGQCNRRSRYRSGHQPPPGEWSIVLSGTNKNQCTPDLEMKIKFPSSKEQYTVVSQSSAGDTEENNENNQVYVDSTKYNHISSRYFNDINIKSASQTIGNESLRVLPEIRRQRDDQKISAPVLPFKAMELTDIRPRQTKTSLRRYNMTRTKLQPLFETNIDDFSIESAYPDIFKKFPQLLSVNGNSISPERKPYIPGYCRRNLPRHNCTPH